MKFVHKIKHAKKYMYHKFLLEVPEIAALFEKEGSDWVIAANARRQEEIKELRAEKKPWGEKKTKKEIKEDLKTIDEGLSDGTLSQVTIENWKNSSASINDIRVRLNKATGAYELQICQEMGCFDKLDGNYGRRKSGVTRWEDVVVSEWEDVVVSEKVIPEDLPVTPMDKEEAEEADSEINWRAR